MRLNVRFERSNQTFDADFGKVCNVSDGGYDRGYSAGYEAGYAKGETDGYSKGVKDGYTDGYTAGCDKVTSETSAILNRTITEYENHNLTALGESALRGCTKLVRADVPNVRRLEGETFRNCTSLPRVDFSKLTFIGTSSFYGCTSLSIVVLRNESEVCTLNAAAFISTPIANGTGLIYVPDNLVEQYKTANQWSNYANQIKPLSELKD